MTETTPAWLLGTGDNATTVQDKVIRQPFRFFLSPGAKKEITFITDYPNSPVIWEHQVWVQRRGRNVPINTTCIRNIPGTLCPLCVYADQTGKGFSRKVRLFAVLDHTPWVDRNKVQHNHSKVILAAPEKVAALIAPLYADRLDEGQTLRGSKLRVIRDTSQTSPQVGSSYSFMKWLDLRLPEFNDTPEKQEMIADLDWLTILAPNHSLLERLKLELEGVKLPEDFTGKVSDSGNEPFAEGNTSTPSVGVQDISYDDDVASL
jgi:hypothetical protein